MSALAVSRLPLAHGRSRGSYLSTRFYSLLSLFIHPPPSRPPILLSLHPLLPPPPARSLYHPLTSYLSTLCILNHLFLPPLIKSPTPPLIKSPAPPLRPLLPHRSPFGATYAICCATWQLTKNLSRIPPKNPAKESR